MTKQAIRRTITTTVAALGLAVLAVAPAMAQSAGMDQEPDNGPTANAGDATMMGGAYGFGMGPRYGVGPGMGCHGGYGQSWGRRGWMMRGYDTGLMSGVYDWGPETDGALGLSDAQQKHIRQIQKRLGRQQWALMQAIHSQMWRFHQAYSKNENINTIIKARRLMFNTRLQMLRNRLEAQQQIRAALTEVQRKKLDELERWRAEYSR